MVKQLIAGSKRVEKERNLEEKFDEDCPLPSYQSFGLKISRGLRETRLVAGESLGMKFSCPFAADVRNFANVRISGHCLLGEGRPDSVGEFHGTVGPLPRRVISQHRYKYPFGIGSPVFSASNVRV